ncbi:hypothetical protein EDC01DRAFT_764959 [Geopyxis carbonaria]|nr:hypothetical protein EDC01DRAFT_764959 [Geopyxis carbonaria]
MALPPGFDSILEVEVNEYKLKDGPQTIPWKPVDKELVIGVLDFTRILVENCGNRSLYASSGQYKHIGELLKTTDLDVIHSALYLGSRLAQRYFTSRTRGSASSNHATLLASHYNINLDHVTKIALPFAKGIGITTTPGSKKISTKAVLPVYATDLGRIARGETLLASQGGGKGKGKATESKECDWEEWGAAWISYYMNPGINPTAKEPVSPTRVRRTSIHHPHPHTSPNQQSSPSGNRTRPDEPILESPGPAITSGLQTLEIPYSAIKEASCLEDILKSTLPELPAEVHYEFLHRLRVASALAGTLETRRKIVAIRILAITNLAYVYPDLQFSQKVGTLDQDEPRRLQLAYQFAELVAAQDEGEVPRWLQTLALGGLESLTRHKARVTDVSNALSLNVNHGVLLYIMRKLLGELGDENADSSGDAEQWREALFSMINVMPTTNNTGSLMVSAGIIPLLIDMINLRTKRAFRYLPRAINLLDQLVYGVQNAFQAFANAQGLDAVVDLVSHEVKTGLEEVKLGNGISEDFCSEQTDYKISHHRQQTLKMVTKFMQHIMTQSGANADRLLRNLIDNPKLLEAIRLVISQSKVWGGNIWSTVVQMISAFIHNEPTSYAVVHEAHITHALLEAITGRTGLAEQEAKKKKEEEESSAQAGESSATGGAIVVNAGDTDTDMTSSDKAPDDSKPMEEILSVDSHRPAAGIMPSQDVIGCIPTAFGAICLNASGLALIQTSRALDAFFEIFESPHHVKILADGDLDNVLGNQFDELVRHHPVLRESVLNATLNMLDKIAALGKKYAVDSGVGAKIWLDDGYGGLVVSGGRSALVGGTIDGKEAQSSSTAVEESDANETKDVEMSTSHRIVRTVPVGETCPDGAPVGEVVRLEDIYDEESATKEKHLAITDFIDASARYLEGFIQNSSQTREFLRREGLQKILQFYNLPSLPYDFATSQANQTLCRAVVMCCEHSLIDTLKLVFKSAQKAVDRLEPLLQHNKKEPFFGPLTNPAAKNANVLPPRLQGGIPVSDEIKSEGDSEDTEANHVRNVQANGTTLVKDLVAMHSLAFLLQHIYQQGQGSFSVRTSGPGFIQTTHDLDKDGLIAKLGMLQRQCVWEEILLQNGIPTTWDVATRVKDSVTDSTVNIEAAVPQLPTSANDESSEVPKSSEEKSNVQKAAVERDGKTSWFRNVKTIRFLIGQIPTTVNPFLQGLAKCVISRRNPDLLHKYLALKLVDSIADTMYTHLTWERLETSESVTEKYGYWIIMLSAVMSLLLEGVGNDYFNTPQSGPPERVLPALTTALITFKQKGGFDVVNSILKTFWDELERLPPVVEVKRIPKDEQQRMAHAYGGIRIILAMFAHLVSNKAVLESVQSQALHQRSSTEYKRADYFNTNQLLVELRAIILPIAKDMWEANSMEKASPSIVKSVVEILGTVLKGDHESSAFTNKDVEKKPGLKNTLDWRTMKPLDEQIKQLTDMGFSVTDARDALMRCNESMEDAANWLSSRREVGQGSSRFEGPPFGRSMGDDEDDEDDEADDDDEDDGTDVDVDLLRDDVATRPQVPAAEPEGVLEQPSATSAPDVDMSGAEPSMLPPPPVVALPPSQSDIGAPSANTSEPATRVRIEDLVAPTLPTGSNTSGESAPPEPSQPPESPKAATPKTEDKGKGLEQPGQNLVTLEYLDELRTSVLDILINRSLDVIQSHPDTTFELAKLITSAFAKTSRDARKEVVSTIILSLLSLQEDDFRPKEKSIASTAHLLGLILQDQTFYETATEDLRDQFCDLVGFIKIYPGEPAPWVAKILLVLEKLLSENAQPEKIKYTPNQEAEQETVVDNSGIKITEEDQHALFDAVISILPDIGKDELLSVAVARVLVLLTRRRDLAIKMMEGGHLRNVFQMYRHQAGNRVDRLQTSLIILLRHIVEDEETVKTFMKAEIRSQFSARATRQLDMNSFTKASAHLILRNPDFFVETVNELCKIVRYDTNLRYQNLVLKESEKEKLGESQIDKEKQKNTEEQAGEGSEGDVKPATEGDKKEEKHEDTESGDKPKPTVELRAPGVERPDGVVHFLLTELLTIKEVKDVTPPEPKKDDSQSSKENEASTTEKLEGAEVPPAEKANEPTKPEKVEFKAEHHPYFFYRAFLLMSIAELVGCYNRCKIEFINFKRNANPREPITPSKPRSGVFNYLLNDVISQDSLTTTDDIEKKKKTMLAEWSQMIFVSLCSHTGEISGGEDGPDLLFVRKFVCETSLKAFKDACSANEPLDSKYARMMSLSETFYRILSVRPSSAPSYGTNAEKTQLQLAKIMLEKNYISALTNALADVDLNYPEASKKVIKYMLKTLKLLSKTAVDLSETSSISTPGMADDDDISIASSMDDIDEMREETPDLYRGSALGLFEGGGMDDDDEGDSYDEDEDDEEMYDDDELDELVDDGGSEMSDDDDEEPGDEEMGVEIVVEGEGGDDSDDEDGDDDTSDEDMEEGEEIDIGDGPHPAAPHYDESGAEEDWQSEGSDDDNDPLDNIARALGVGDDRDVLEDEQDDGFLDDEVDEDEDIDGDEDDDDLDDEDEAMFQEEYDDDEGGSPWGLLEGNDPPVMTRAQPRGAGGWFTLSGAPREPPAFMSRAGRPRHYISGAGDRARDIFQSQNPLLQQVQTEPIPHRSHQRIGHEFMHELIDGMHAGAASGPVSMISTLMNLMNRGGTMPNGTIQFQATIPHSNNRHFHHGMHREIRSMFGNFRASGEHARHHRGDFETALGPLESEPTSYRWTDEARSLFGTRTEENAQRVMDTIMACLVPPAIEEEKIRKEKEEEEKKERQRLEEQKQKEEEERIAKEKAEEEERLRKEAEDKEAAERARLEAEAHAAEAAVSAPESGEAAESSEPTEEGMEGIENTEVASAEPGPSAPPAERATVTIRGQEMDITGMGIDPEFLEAIPEDMREEALSQHIRERRAAAASSDQPSEISQEFLDALPDDIREEVLQQESADRRRREQETAQGRQGGAVDIDLATFIATLEPGLRQTVLMEQDEESLAQLPHAIVEEANALRGDRGFNRYADNLPRAARGPNALRRPEEPKQPKKITRKGTVQLLDKAGVATLLRLMFIPQAGTTRIVLHEILHNICENRQNRAEVVNLLLSILQDGSADMVAVERSFAQLSVRAKQSAVQKTPVKPSLHRTNTGSLAQTSGEVSPLLVAQQCLHALLFLVSYNERIPSYFLNEHDISTGLKRTLSRKGKGKAVETKSSKYALNTLLGLLDRPLITENTNVMEQLSVLLSEITRPLTQLLKKDKKKNEDEKPKDEQSVPEPTISEPAPSAILPSAEPTATTQPAEPSVEGSSEESKDADKANDESTESDKNKKSRTLVPPIVPEYNLRLVVNILTARECSSKTFRETLATMQNLSGIPGAKDVFGGELIRQAQGLGSILLGHLDGLLQQIKSAENGTEVQGMALANFSPASSEQAKLLRVLTALDYLFDPKRTQKDKPEEKSEDKTSGDSKAEQQTDILSQLHNSLAFTPLWDKLSQCLTAIHEREDLLHVATILLPSIEALMVICKNSGLEEKDALKTGHVKPSPEIHTGMRKLFFGFTEEHRKILNQMVRNNPKLMSGSFALLVNNPKVLDFDNKRNYFTRKLHTRNGIRDPHPTLQLNVRRDQVFMDSYKSMYYKSGDEIKFAKLSIRFSNEEGVDAGGVTREWFQVMARQMFNPGYALFIPVASDRTTFHPNSLSGVNQEHLHFFKFIGRIIGKALYEGRVLDCHFSRAVYKRILGKSVSLKDMETLDLEYYKSLLWMLENDITDIITETFSVEVDEFGARRTIGLIPDGANISVTQDNKQEYVRLMVEHKLLHSVKDQIDHFLQGFYDIVPANLISIFNEQELELLISGMPEIDMDDWKNNTEYHNYSASSPQIQWFWRAVRSFDKEERAKLLQFVTGTSKVPLNGFKELEGMNGFSKFNIHRDYGNKDRLPSSHTCFNQLDLPEYESYEALRQQLLTAITQGAEYFGFA